MKLLLIFGSIFILSVYAADEPPKKFNVGYARVTAENKLSLCGIDDEIKPIEGTNTVKAQLTIEDENRDVEVIDIPGTFTEDNNCIEFDYSTHTTLNGKKHDIFTKVTVDTIDNVKEAKNTVIEYEFKGIFTFTELKADIDVKLYNEVNIIQFKNGEVAAFQVDEGPIKIPECNTNKDLCVSPDAGPFSDPKNIKIYNGKTDTIPNSNPKSLDGSILQCADSLDITAVYDNVAKTGFEITANSGGDITKYYAVSNNVLFDLGSKKITTTEDIKVIKHDENKCEIISATVRTMTFLDPFSKTVEVSWTKDTDQYYLEVSETVTKNLHIDCSGIDVEPIPGTCIAYVFDNNMPTDEDLTYQLSAASGAPDIRAYSAGKSKTKQIHTHVDPNPGGPKSLKALNLNQFEINWNTKQGKLCVEDALYEKNKKSQFRYELVIGFDDGNWNKHIANYNDESTICFNDFEITQLIENKLGVHFLVMKRGSDTNQILASDMITTDLIVPEISEVNDETISLEFENLNSPFLIRDEKTKMIISKNEKKIHNLAFLKSSHENKSLFNRNMVLETRKEHTQMKVHFKIPQKVNAA